MNNKVYMDLMMARSLIFAEPFEELMEENIKKDRTINEINRKINEINEKIKESERQRKEIDKMREESERTRNFELIALFHRLYPNEDSNFLESLPIYQYKNMFHAMLKNEPIEKLKEICKKENIEQ